MKLNLVYSENEIVDHDYDFLITSQTEHEKQVQLANNIRESSNCVEVSTNFESQRVSLNSIFQKALEEINESYTKDDNVIGFVPFRKKCDENWKRLWGLFSISPDILFENGKRVCKYR